METSGAIAAGGSGRLAGVAAVPGAGVAAAAGWAVTTAADASATVAGLAVDAGTRQVAAAHNGASFPVVVHDGTEACVHFPAELQAVWR